MAEGGEALGLSITSDFSSSRGLDTSGLVTSGLISFGLVTSDLFSVGAW